MFFGGVVVVFVDCHCDRPATDLLSKSLIPWRSAVSRLAIIKGTLDVLVLRALKWQPMHGFEITAWLEGRSGNRLALEDAALYQALYRMEKRELVTAEWGMSENQRRARYYHITTAGRASLNQQTRDWLRYSETLTDILTGPQDIA